jgi:hypothetical protein
VKASVTSMPAGRSTFAIDTSAPGVSVIALTVPAMSNIAQAKAMPRSSSTNGGVNGGADSIAARR